MNLLWFENLLLMRLWVWNAYLVSLWNRACGLPKGTIAFWGTLVLRILTVDYTFNPTGRVPWCSGWSYLLGKLEIAGSNPTLAFKLEKNKMFLPRSLVKIQYVSQSLSVSVYGSDSGSGSVSACFWLWLCLWLCLCLCLWLCLCLCLWLCLSLALYLVLSVSGSASVCLCLWLCLRLCLCLTLSLSVSVCLWLCLSLSLVLALSLALSLALTPSDFGSGSVSGYCSVSGSLSRSFRNNGPVQTH